MAGKGKPCIALWGELTRVQFGIYDLLKGGFGPGTEVYDKLYKELGSIKGRLGMRSPSATLRMGARVKGSPAEFDVFFDSVRGWSVRARADEWAPWVTHYVDGETAVKVVSEKLTLQLERQLLTPVTYVGEE